MSGDGGDDAAAAAAAAAAPPPPPPAPQPPPPPAPPGPLDPPVPPPATVEAILADYVARRHGLLTALTHDFDALYAAADPAAPALCLAAGPDGTWTLGPPHAAVPPPLPEPCVGINFARDGTTTRREWATVLAAHCDAWLMSVVTYFSGAAGLDAGQRAALFESMNALDPLFESVGAWSAAHSPPPEGGGGVAGGRGTPGQPVSRGGGSGPRPPGRPLAEGDVGAGLKGARAALFWPDDARWYAVEIRSVTGRTAAVRYETGETESLDLEDVMRDGHMLLVE